MKGWTRATIVVCGLSCMAGAAMAQEASAETGVAAPATTTDTTVAVDPESAPPAPVERRQGGLGIEEIVVTAQRHEEGINEVPIAITAFTGEALQQLGVTDTRDLGNVIPGLSVSNAGFNKPVYTLRGVGFNETSQTASSTVGVYIDEVNFPFDIMTKGANLDISRIEVLKGPQGTLYGRNTTGGAINYVANKPTDTFESGLDVTYGRFETVDADGFVSGRLTDTVRARVAAREVNSQEGWQVSNTRPGDTLGKVDKQSGRLIIDWQAADTLPIALTLQGWRDHSQPQAPQAIAIRPQNQQLGAAALSPSVSDYPLVPFNSSDNQVADWSPEFPWQLKDRFLMASLRGDWSVTDTTTLTVQGAYEDYLSNHSLLPQSGLNTTNTENDLFDTTRAANLEARVAGTWFDEGKWQLGSYLSRDTVHEDSLFFVDTNSAVFPTPLGPALANRLAVLADQTATTEAVFGHTELPFLDTFKGTLGVRYTNEVRDYKGCSADSPQNSSGTGFFPLIDGLELAGPVTNPGSPAPTMLANGGCFTVNPATNNAGYFVSSLGQSNVSGRAAVDWEPEKGKLLYLSYSRGFKSGSYPAISASSTAQLQPVGQEKLDAFETGGKLGFFESVLEFNYALFYYDYTDKQLLSREVDPIFGPLPVLRNAPKSQVLGAEAELQFTPIQGLYLSTSATYLDTDVIEFTGVNESGVTENFAGKPFNFAPKYSFLALANEVLPMSDGLDLSLGADYSYKSATNSVLGGDPEFKIPAYGIVNVRAGVGAHEGSWSLTVFARNLFNEFYTVSTFDPGDSVARFVGMTRTYGLTLSLRFE